jgi:hypothetical protein
MPFKSEKQRKWMFANKPKLAKKWAKKENIKQETRVQSLIKKMVREKNMIKLNKESVIKIKKFINEISIDYRNPILTNQYPINTTSLEQDLLDLKLGTGKYRGQDLSTRVDKTKNYIAPPTQYSNLLYRPGEDKGQVRDLLYRPGEDKGQVRDLLYRIPKPPTTLDKVNTAITKNPLLGVGGGVAAAVGLNQLLKKKKKKEKMVYNAAGDLVPASTVAGHPDFKPSSKPYPGERDPSVRASREK